MSKEEHDYANFTKQLRTQAESLEKDPQNSEDIIFLLFRSADVIDRLMRQQKELLQIIGPWPQERSLKSITPDEFEEIDK